MLIRPTVAQVIKPKINGFMPSFKIDLKLVCKPKLNIPNKIINFEIYWKNMIFFSQYKI